jgi:hypothetical protein
VQGVKNKKKLPQNDVLKQKFHVNLMKLALFGQIFGKSSKIKFLKNLSSESRVIPSGRTVDRYSFPVFMILVLFGQIFEGSIKIKFHENPSSERFVP